MVLSVYSSCTLSPSIPVVSGEGLYLGVQGPLAVLHVEHLDDPLQAIRHFGLWVVSSISFVHYTVEVSPNTTIIFLAC